MKKNKEKEIKLSKAEQRVFDYMLEHGSITSMDAFLDLGESRLSAMIFNLKKKGVLIGDERLEVQNRFHEKRYIKKYWIA